MTQVVTTAEQVADFVRSNSRVRVAGGGTKTALSGSANVSLSGLTGVLQYEPAEFTFTALAGTRLAEVKQMLAAKNQYLPFDPILVEAGATLGGTVAAGLSGSGRFRYGGVRDFLLGAQIITGSGEIVTTGSKVVKNSAGFDFPKLMVGSLGRFGVMTELTFKVFPAPQSYTTVVLRNENLTDAIELMNSLATSQLDLACLDMDPSLQICVRVAGMQDSIEQRGRRVLQYAANRGAILTKQQDAEHWQECSEFGWVPDGHSLIKVAITPQAIPEIREQFGNFPYLFCSGGQLAWLTWPAENSSQEFGDKLCKLGLSAVALTGDWPTLWGGKHVENVFGQRLAAAMDPSQKFRLSGPTRAPGASS